MDGEIGVEELASRLEDDDAAVVDIRSPRAFDQAHIPGSENVPLNRLVDEVERFEGEDRVATVCPHGKSSVQAARLIASYEGFDGTVESFAPGLDGWDGPLEATESDEADEGPAAPF
ncbi:rhodanese-like domain-containing protein [Halomicroarcula sp. GCM10025709]|uniref:rhodanese-like domain-containing protein n=1 Tax=Haloarcula TaxID=2237 RepID=UPI0024C299FC|nr:rhodanese-like domain-containing protein [Halomicroarcula sp. YJ-61-S]